MKLFHLAIQALEANGNIVAPRYIPILPRGRASLALDDLQRLALLVLRDSAAACGGPPPTPRARPASWLCCTARSCASFACFSSSVNCAVAACCGMFRFGKVPVSVGPPLRPSAVGTSSTVERAAGGNRATPRPEPPHRCRGKTVRLYYMSYLRPSLRNRTHWTSHDNMSRKRCSVGLDSGGMLRSCPRQPSRARPTPAKRRTSSST